MNMKSPKSKRGGSRAGSGQQVLVLRPHALPGSGLGLGTKNGARTWRLEVTGPQVTQQRDVGARAAQTAQFMFYFGRSCFTLASGLACALPANSCLASMVGKYGKVLVHMAARKCQQRERSDRAHSFFILFFSFLGIFKGQG